LSKPVRQLTPMMLQYLQIKEEVPDYILMYRLGDFYEMFYEDAVIASEALDLVLTSRNAGGGEKAPLCGVPYHSVDGYIQTLVEKGFNVALAEQMEDPKFAKGLVDRQITKLITAGTRTDAQMLSRDENNYLASVAAESGSYALCYCDISTFFMRATVFEGEDAHKELIEEIRTLSPSEIITAQPEILPEAAANVTELSTSLMRREKAAELASRFLEKSYLSSMEPLLLRTLGELLQYIVRTQLVEVDTRFDFSVYAREDYLLLDPTAINNLELFETLRTKEKRGSLIWVIDRTSNPMGARLLRQWVKRPLRDINAILHRQNVVDSLFRDERIRSRLRNSFKKVGDLERLVSKLVYTTLNPKEVVSLSRSLSELPDIVDALLALPIGLVDIPDTLSEVTKRIDETILDDPAATTREGGYIRSEYNEELQETVFVMEHAGEMLISLEEREREATSIKNLKIKYNRVFGYFFDVTNSYSHLVPDHFIRKQTLRGSERYFTEELKTLEEKILGAEEKRNELEREIYDELIKWLKGYSNAILEVAAIISKVDVLSSFAQLAIEEDYVRPALTHDDTFILRESRHPVIEKMIGRDRFVRNDLVMNRENRFYILTGPNMAGKSTYLRQVALSVLLAQIGSFVPASEALIPICDAIFTRVGASDDLAMGASTFMVEMSELSYILQHCTNESLVILDEVGRGTSTFDGLSIAWALVEYLTRTELHPRTLFATHYHELTQLEDVLKGVKNYRITLRKLGKELVFLRKILPGKSMRSYGIEAAQMAGLPEDLTIRAREILSRLERNEIHEMNEAEEVQSQTDPLADLLDDVRIEELTPLEALNLLNEVLKRRDDEN